ncbi:hypothetical protein BV898_12093 [Hypsibius exemplaris]|uniref:G-protein coupled receptors family 1 profile domain-containing protein n=1 Tax=Hypsibius exemplaris TaxID=2072580 RepID=A0A1W0WES5_HYPEX|nr:hypothetical protein BV898_12093 [Hypsibius exemplaris]
MNHSNFSPPTNFPFLAQAKQTELSAWIAVILTINFIGVLINLLLLRITWLAKLQKCGVSFLIVHFLLANLVMSLVSVPAGVFVLLAKRDGWHIDGSACYIVQTLVTINMTVINWADVGLAVNRFVALYYPHRYKAWASTPTNVAVLCCNWFISVATMIPYTFTIGGQGIISAPLGNCFLMMTGRLGPFLTAMMAYVPYTLTGIGSLLILWKCFGYRVLDTATVSSADGDSSVGANHRLAQRRLNMAKMLLFTFLWTCVCTLPTYVVNTQFPWLYGANPVSVMWIRPAMTCQFTFTPCILLWCNTEYQRRLKCIFTQHRGSFAGTPSTGR